MKHAIFFPLYNIHSELVKTALGLKDPRSVERFFRDAGVTVHLIGKKKCVTYEDLSNVTRPKPRVMHYQGKSEMSRQLDDLD